MDTKKLTPNQKKLRQRILEISYEAKTSHIGSCLSVIDLIDGIYSVKAKNDRFILSSGHAAVSLYVVLEKNGIIKVANLEKFHIHPDRSLKFGIDVSTGSLGQGLPIAAGMAFADRGKNIYTIISDGECTEGSIWETLRVAYDLHLNNLFIFINTNGWGAYDRVSVPKLLKRLKGFCPNIKVINGHKPDDINEVFQSKHHKYPTVVMTNTISEQFPFLKGQDAHYHVMSEADFKLAKELLNE